MRIVCVWYRGTSVYAALFCAPVTKACSPAIAPRWPWSLYLLLASTWMYSLPSLLISSMAFRTDSIRRCRSLETAASAKMNPEKSSSADVS